MAKETTGELPAVLLSPKNLSITIVRLSAEDLTFESPEPFAPRSRVRVQVRLGEDRTLMEFDAEIVSSEDTEGAVFCDARLSDPPPAVRRRLVTFIDDIVREEYLKEVQAGDEIFKEGETSTHIYYIALGRFVVDKGGEKIAEISEEDQFVGEMSFLLGLPRTATVTALTDSLIMAVPADVFQKSLSENPRMGIELAKLLAKRLASTSQHLAQSLHHT
ncbi:MAG: hypothetical protein A3G34_04540 [Candidatus Lindowbacteria bacterium RIFCSPLOWO2_12_FULL_62_27]|nr:MAG: hypothetical protein A3I06_04300 [Candidatus Lindowbacteria bacterium RIFCSPLOWO2_02_FULL_62_12]OGH57429.1 MAG: hypothetical protein A3G34_04540 [Candidatus Lindowbacteria bacterium RIFCSPLOWO2_12_FULL_62_27]